jgi:hypothetical protein
MAVRRTGYRPLVHTTDSAWPLAAPRNRTVQQLRDFRPQDSEETETLLGELATAGLLQIVDAPDGERIVSINSDSLGAVGTA